MKKILIVDDQVEIIELVDATIRMEDYQIIKGKSGKDAVDIAKAEKPDLIIIDVKMPGEIDGFEATRIIKNDPETKNCALILMSGKDQKTDFEKGLKAGADDYIVKPFDPDNLVKKVKEFLE